MQEVAAAVGRPGAAEEVGGENGAADAFGEEPGLAGSERGGDLGGSLLPRRNVSLLSMSSSVSEEFDCPSLRDKRWMIRARIRACTTARKSENEGASLAASMSGLSLR